MIEPGARQVLSKDHVISFDIIEQSMTKAILGKYLCRSCFDYLSSISLNPGIRAASKPTSGFTFLSRDALHGVQSSKPSCTPVRQAQKCTASLFRWPSSFRTVR